MKNKYYIIFVLFFFSCKGKESEKNEIFSNQNASEPVKMNKFPLAENEIGVVNLNKSVCRYDISSREESITLYYPRNREVEQIKSIVKYAGLPMNFEVYRAGIKNAIATIIENKRLVIYDPSLFDYADENSESFWGSMSILAHEIGHHFSGHTLESLGSNHKDELEADKFSGFILQKMGATIGEAKRAMSLISSEEASPSHPSKKDRMKAIEQGWKDANTLRYEAAIPPPPEDIINPVGGVSKFNTENLLNELSYGALLAKNGQGSWVSGMMDGIIVDRFGTSGYLVLITDTSDENADYFNQKLDIDLLNIWDSYSPLPRIGYSYLSAILVPGRRIRIAFIEEGNVTSRHFAYIESLPGSMY